MPEEQPTETADGELEDGVGPDGGIRTGCLTPRSYVYKRNASGVAMRQCQGGWK